HFACHNRSSGRRYTGDSASIGFAVKRLLSFIFKIIFILALAVWLANRPGTARIVWHDYVIETSAAFLGFCIFVAALVLYFVFRFWHLIKNGPEMWRLRRRLNR